MIDWRLSGSPGVGNTATENGRTTVTVDLGAERQVSVTNGVKFRDEVASTLGHEARHGIDQQSNGMPFTRSMEKATELRAATTEAYVWKGLGAPALWGTWTGTRIDPATIEKEADASTQFWCANGGNCH
jgi:hypothetical protein